MLAKYEIYGIVLAILIAGMAAAGLYERHEGRVEGRKEVQDKFDLFVAQVNAAGEKARADQLAQQQERDRITQQQEKAHADQITTINARYAAAIAKLRPTQATAGSGSGGVQPIPATLSVCNDAAKDARFLDAFSSYRQAVLGLLQQAEQQTGQLVESQAWIRAQQLVGTTNKGEVK